MTTTCCPVCSSLRVIRELRPCIGMETDGDTTYMVNGSVSRCMACGHLWDRTASRGLGPQNYPQVKRAQPAPRPGFWTRLFQRLFPIT